jgi:hypothetical protein
MKKIGIAVGLFIIALLPRIFGLGLFITSDEPLWLTRSIFFSEGLLTGNLADTLQTGHPGVTTMWTGNLGLALAYLQRGPTTTFLEFLQTLPHNFERIDATLLPWVRLPTVLLAALGVALFYWLARKLVDDHVALIGALLLAFDPLFLAHSRTLHHDALATIFLSLSVLTLLNYAVAEKSSARWYLVLSGGLAGLALLSKGTSLTLIAFAALFFLWQWVRQKQTYGQIVVAGLLWLGMAVSVFVALWPAMWVIPGQVLTEVFGWVITSADVDEVVETTTFNWAGRVPDLGILFYPVNWLLKSTLLSLVGLVALVGWWRSPQNRGQRWVITWLAIFALLFLVLLTIGDKRDGRYLLPIYPGLWLLTAAGLTWLAQRILDAVESGRGNALRLPFLRLPQETTAGARPYKTIATKFGLIIIFAVLLLGFSIPWYPYYHSYYNPIIGGSWLAPRLIKVGWGEGMEQAAAYLNQQPGADRLVVATSYAQNFLPFFAGSSVKHHQNQPADYVLNYIRQTQNGYPYPEYWEYYRPRPPVFMLREDGLDYLWLYPGPHLNIVRNAEFEDGLTLMGFVPDQWAVQPGQTTTLTLIWRLSPEDFSQTVHIRLQDESDVVWVESSGPVLDPAGPSPVEGHYQLTIPPEMPRGDYELWVAVGCLDEAISENVAWFKAGTIPARQLDKPSLQFANSINFGNLITFGGANLGQTTILPDQSLDVELWWQPLHPISNSYTIFVHLIDESGNIWGQLDHIPKINDRDLPTTTWQKDEWIIDTFQLYLKPDAPAGSYTLLVGVYDSQNFERLPVVGQQNNQTIFKITSITVPLQEGSRYGF